jgi:ferrous iron transport protein B
MAVRIALAGNPNCGKTTMFNALTGSNQYVGNWPGVTVEKKEGHYKANKDVIITDLPGIYSLSPYTLEEVVSRNYILEEQPEVIINLVDATNIERNLYLTTQILELGIPVVVALNMMDLIKKSGDKIDIKKLSQELGCEVVETSALQGKGLDELINKAIEASTQKTFVNKIKFDEKTEKAIADAEAVLPQSACRPEQRRWFSVKLLENDNKVVEKLTLSSEDNNKLSAIRNELEQANDDEVESVITNARYEFITDVMKKAVVKEKKALSTSDKIDKIVTNRILALPIFAVVMIIVYYISVTTAGTIFTDWANDGVFGDGWYLAGIGRSDYDDAVTEYAKDNIWTDDLIADVDAAIEAGAIGAEDVMGAIEDEDYGAFEEAVGSYEDSIAEVGVDISYVDEQMEAEDFPANEDYGIWIPGIPVFIENALDAIGCADWLKSLILDGIVAGVGAVLGFVPQMLILFIFLAFLESCGYMARVAFIMDRIFRKFGLSGKSFIPILIGTGCGVPGVMASRTIENERDRRMTIMTTTFIPCGAKLPIIALISAALFGNAWWVAPSAYFLGIAAIIISGIILKKTKIFAGEPAPFVMELPAYHWPTVGTVLRSMWERGSSFIKKAGTIILLSSIIIWAGSVFGWTEGVFGFNADMELADSILGKLGDGLKWIFMPLGFGEATATVATIMGLVAKEEVVGVFGVLDFEGLAPVAGYSFLAFNLLCAPCFAAIGAIKREMNNAKWTWFAIAYQCGLGYIVALIIYQLGMLFTTGSFGIGTVFAIVALAAIIYALFRKNKYKDLDVVVERSVA